MVFNFLKYIKAIWSFNIRPDIDFGYFPTKEQLHAISFQVPPDSGYQSDAARDRDLAWVALQSGVIQNGAMPGIDVWQKVVLPVVDEYRFVRKYFHSLWSLYCLIIRIVTFHNPFIEIRSFLKTKNIKRVDSSAHPFSYREYEGFKSNLIRTNPLISIIIPTLNRYEYLRDVLNDLEIQTYKNFEVILVDQSENFDAAFYEGWKFQLRFWKQEEKALWNARNSAIKAAKGDLLLFYDDDSRVDADWIFQHLKCIDFFNADISSGVSLSSVGAKVPSNYSFFRWSDQMDTGNVLIRKSVFEKIGLFDLKFEKQRMGDGEYGIRAYLAGLRNVSNPLAKRIHLKVPVGGLRQMGSWDAFRPKRLLSPRPIPSVNYLSRKYFGNTSTIFQLIINVPPSFIPYRFKRNNAMLLFGCFLFIIFIPIAIIPVLISWKKSSEMLRSISKIEYINIKNK